MVIRPVKVGRDYKLYNKSMLDMAMLFNAAFTGLVVLVLLNVGVNVDSAAVLVLAAVMVFLPLGMWEVEKKWIL